MFSNPPIGLQTASDTHAFVGLLQISTLRMLLAVVLGSVIGLERESHHKPAGMRTGAFICMGAAFFTLCSQLLALHFGGDPQRIASQIIPGIGFLGGGAILRDRGAITGMTSAATVFMVAAIGMACGGGLYLQAVIVTGLALLVLLALRWLERRLHIKLFNVHFTLVGAQASNLLGDLTRLAEQEKVALSSLDCKKIGDEVVVEFATQLETPASEVLLQQLRQLPAVHQAARTIISSTAT